MHMKTLELNI